MRQRTPCFDIRTTAAGAGHARVAIVVPKFDETAVARNRVKRRLRELVRRELLPVLVPCDVVIRATRASYAASFAALQASMHVARRRLGEPG